MAADETKLCETELQQLSLYKQYDPREQRKGTTCELEDDITTGDFVSIFSTDNDLQDNEGRSALDWYNKTTVERLTNFDSDYAKKAVQSYQGKYQGLNTSKYDIKVSQSGGDGWEKFGPANDFDSCNDDITTLEAIDEDKCPFMGTLDNMQSSLDGTDRKASEAAIFKSVYELMGKYDMGDPSVAKIMLDQLDVAKERLKVNHEKEHGKPNTRNDDKIRFSNTSIGNNRKDMISRR